MSELCPIWLNQETLEAESMLWMKKIVSHGWKNIECILDFPDYRTYLFMAKYRNIGITRDKLSMPETQTF